MRSISSTWRQNRCPSPKRMGPQTLNVGNGRHKSWEWSDHTPAACETHQERLIVWTLLDTGLRVSELAGLTREHIDWQNHRLMIYGKGGIYGTKSKRRIIPLTDRIRPLIDGHFAIHDTIGMTPRTIQR